MYFISGISSVFDDNNYTGDTVDCYCDVIYPGCYLHKSWLSFQLISKKEKKRY